MAARNGHADTVKFFLCNNLPDNFTSIAVRLAAKYGHTKTVEAIVYDYLPAHFRANSHLDLQAGMNHMWPKYEKVLSSNVLPTNTILRALKLAARYEQPDTVAIVELDMSIFTEFLKQ